MFHFHLKLSAFNIKKTKPPKPMKPVSLSSEFYFQERIVLISSNCIYPYAKCVVGSPYISYKQNREYCVPRKHVHTTVGFKMSNSLFET